MKKGHTLYPLLALLAIFSMMLLYGAPVKASILSCAIIGSLYIYGNWIYRDAPANQSSKKYAFIQDESLFNNSILVLLASVIKADSKTGEVELRYIEESLRIHFSQDKVKSNISYIKSLCNQETIEIDSICKTIDHNYKFNEKIQLLHFIVGVVCSDGLLTSQERKIIADISRRIKIPNRSLNGIYNMFNFITEEEAEQRRKRRAQGTSKVSSNSLKKAYEILGIEMDATEKQIKKAYRFLAMQHHPDKLIHLGKEYQKSAKEKFVAISDAYELIKSKKGFN